MRRAWIIGLTALLLLAGSGPTVVAQRTDGTPADVKIETERKRTIVKPPADAASGAAAADSMADKLDQERRVETLRRKAMEPATLPPLDTTTVEGSRARQRQELPGR